MPTLNHRRGRKQPCELSKWLHLNPLEAGPWAYKLHWLWATSPWAGVHASVAEGHTGPGRDCSVATSHLIILVAEGKDDAGGQTSLGLDQLVGCCCPVDTSGSLCVFRPRLSLPAKGVRQFPGAWPAGSSGAREAGDWVRRAQPVPPAMGRASGAANPGQGSRGPASREPRLACTQSCCLLAGQCPGLPAAGSAVSGSTESVSSFIRLPAHISCLMGSPCPSSALASLP